MLHGYSGNQGQAYPVGAPAPTIMPVRLPSDAGRPYGVAHPATMQPCSFAPSPWPGTMTALPQAMPSPSPAIASLALAAPAPQPSATVAAPPIRVLVLVRPDCDGHFDDPLAVGHPANLAALSGAGARVEIVRASCLCQGRRLAAGEQVTDFVISQRSQNFSIAPGAASTAAAGAGDAAAAALARGLTHVRCWLHATSTADADEPCSAPVVVLEASARASAGRGTWGTLLQAVAQGRESGEAILLLSGLSAGASAAAASLAAAYAFSPRGLQALRSQRKVLPCMVAPVDRMLQELLGSQGVQRGGSAVAGPALRPIASPGRAVRRLPLLSAAFCSTAGGRALQANPCRERPSSAPLTAAPTRPGSVKVVLITLPHRADRRVEPLVGSDAALAAMRATGVDVEILQASCYCERDALESQGSLGCFVDGSAPEHYRFRRYPGAKDPMSPEEAERLVASIDDNYVADSSTLIDPACGSVETYVVDTNWPGATSCAMSHLRALIGAAVAGYEHVVVFEDDAIIPMRVAKPRGWCEGCGGSEVCLCPSAWGRCISEAVELMRRSPSLDLLYLGLGEVFETQGPRDGILAGNGAWASLRSYFSAGEDDSSVSKKDLGGVTELGYTWCAHALVYSRSALDDILSLRLWELLWAQDETIPHLYCRKPWNDRFVRALRNAGWRRRWVAGAPSECFQWHGGHRHDGWVDQLEMVEDVASLQLGTAAQSSNSDEF
eukprot:TRINITY_DN16631_c0_g5_i1.p1 TRINITY_DN16631_c0_g5~~TRINITY_DN16631_c0_g5_i1.p1  ORF type:complete len:724 (+),score=109.92 TRINITY_DN16631_c0_g5_i1:62-2233(+)